MTKSKQHALHATAKAKAYAAMTRQLKSLATEMTGSSEGGRKLMTSFERGAVTRAVAAFAAVAFPLMEARDCLR